MNKHRTSIAKIKFNNKMNFIFAMLVVPSDAMPCYECDDNVIFERIFRRNFIKNGTNSTIY